ncbi:MAG: hypothetical protein JXA30_06230 [Deltaproteobacteria bacterium]|nr:hypothetical protein [Deltaproteobacteria bacterium]
MFIIMLSKYTNGSRRIRSRYSGRKRFFLTTILMLLLYLTLGNILPPGVEKRIFLITPYSAFAQLGRPSDWGERVGDGVPVDDPRVGPRASRRITAGDIKVGRARSRGDITSGQQDLTARQVGTVVTNLGTKAIVNDTSLMFVEVTVTLAVNEGAPILLSGSGKVTKRWKAAPVGVCIRFTSCEAYTMTTGVESGTAHVSNTQKSTGATIEIDVHVRQEKISGIDVSSGYEAPLCLIFLVPRDSAVPMTLQLGTNKLKLRLNDSPGGVTKKLRDCGRDGR